MPTPPTRVRAAICAALITASMVALGGCAKMDASLGQQWLTVQFNPNTTTVIARHITASCSHVPNVNAGSVTPDAAETGMVESVRYNVSNASDADMARLQECLQRFRSVQGVVLNDSGGY